MDKKVLKFLIPSIIGVFVFIVPIQVDGILTLPLGYMSDQLLALLGDANNWINFLIILFSALISLVAFVKKDLFKNEFLKGLFGVSPFWLTVRILGFVTTLMVFFEIGPEAVWHKYTGGVMFYELMPPLLGIFFFASFFIPVLLEFGVLEFVGTIVRPIMRPIFKLPGRSAIDCLASSLAGSPIGVVMTNHQYVHGRYSGREAAVISTSFALVTLPVIYIFTTYMELETMFPVIYLSTVVAALITNFIMVRIPPLSKKPDDYYQDKPNVVSEEIPEGKKLLPYALELAVNKADEVESGKKLFGDGLKILADIYFSLFPIVMFLGTLSLVVAEFTPFFTYLSYPFMLLLTLFRVPDAQIAAPSLVVGFADVFLPFILGGAIPSLFTRFVVAVVAINQIIYMTEVGVLLLKLELPVKLLDLVIIFVQRTVISLPIAIIIAHLLGL